VVESEIGREITLGDNSTTLAFFISWQHLAPSAMSSPASPIGVYRGVLPTHKEIAYGTKPQLQKLLKTVNPVGFQPTTVPALRTVLLDYVITHKTVFKSSSLEREAKTASSLSSPTTSQKFPPTTNALHVSPQNTPHRRVLETDSLI